MKYVFMMCAALLATSVLLPVDASAVDRGRGVKGGFTGQEQRGADDQKWEHKKKNKDASTKKKKGSQ